MGELEQLANLVAAKRAEMEAAGFGDIVAWLDAHPEAGMPAPELPASRPHLSTYYEGWDDD